MSYINLHNIRVRIGKNKHPIYKELVSASGTNAEDYPFATMKDLFMVAACMGAKLNRYKEPGATLEIFAGNVFDAKTDMPVLAAVAYQRRQDLKTLLDPKQLVEIAEAYAHGGIGMLRDELVQGPSRPLSNFVAMLFDEIGDTHV